MAKQDPSPMRRVLRLPAEIAVGIYFVVDATLGPLFRPLMRWLSGLRLVQRLERAIASLPPYVLLVLLVVPFAIAELAKVYSVVLMGTGHFSTGVSLYVGAYIISLFVCERIFHAGKAQLMTIGWFARGFRWIMRYKERLVAWFRTTEAWRLACAVRHKGRLVARRFGTRLAARFGGKSFGGKPLDGRSDGLFERN